MKGIHGRGSRGIEKMEWLEPQPVGTPESLQDNFSDDILTQDGPSTEVFCERFDTQKRVALASDP